jgi:hypothetical protein
MNLDAVLEIARFPLGAGLVAANVAVWFGVWLERDSAAIEVREKGWRILVRGLAAETAIGFFVFALDTSIGIRQTAEITAASERADTAELQIASAKDQAATAMADAAFLGVSQKDLHDFVTAQKAANDAAIADLKRNTIGLEKARKEATEAAAGAKKDLADMQTALAQERQLRAAMASTITNRQLSAAQQTAVANEMQKWVIMHGTTAPNVAVFSVSGSFESASLADQIAAALTKAHFSVNRNAVTMGQPIAVSGVGMFTSADPRGNPVAGALAAALTRQGILAFVIPEHWKGCENPTAKDVGCSAFSVEVGDIPLLPAK